MGRRTQLGGVVLVCALAGAAGCSEPEPPAEPLPEPAEVVCDQQAAPIKVNEAYRPTMHQTGDGYPATCQYYAVTAPEGYAQLDVAVSGMSADLDISVQYGACAFKNEWESDGDTWSSNQDGTADEAIRISAPLAGTYFVEVCSYSGDATPYTLSTSLK